ncbi:hypothetical protein [Tengunoibacter tsumagoiensis]|uniref:Uncharacterized protein n=1 Tax=Tengunoibacter tsumagoiensis TaxID=2014871 RepID=A0A401ZWK3_9CHLR|nr:hypothetical protein [Tengunoibacter tsumagoiensis]GCE11114.1 hypothetical protein KTT_09730 [Tengunoibacter tsumagoiensis]
MPNDTYSSGSSTFPALSSAVVLIIALVVLASIVLGIIIWWRIFSKTGYSGALSLVFLFIPFGAFILLLVLAFSEWPVQRELNLLRQQQAMRGPGYSNPSNPQYPPQQPYSQQVPPPYPPQRPY